MRTFCLFVLRFSISLSKREWTRSTKRKSANFSKLRRNTENCWRSRKSRPGDFRYSAGLKQPFADAFIKASLNWSRDVTNWWTLQFWSRFLQGVCVFIIISFSQNMKESQRGLDSDWSLGFCVLLLCSFPDSFIMKIPEEMWTKSLILAHA